MFNVHIRNMKLEIKHFHFIHQFIPTVVVGVLCFSQMKKPLLKHPSKLSGCTVMSNTSKLH